MAGGRRRHRRHHQRRGHVQCAHPLLYPAAGRDGGGPHDAFRTGAAQPPAQPLGSHFAVRPRLGAGARIHLRAAHLHRSDLVWRQPGAQVLKFAALIALRIKQPKMVRPFRIPGGMVGVWVVSVCPVALLGYAAYASRSEQVAHMPALLFGLLVAAGGPVCYLVSRRWWGRPIPTPQPTEIAAD
jgi:hypothetical protein